MIIDILSNRWHATRSIKNNDFSETFSLQTFKIILNFPRFIFIRLTRLFTFSFHDLCCCPIKPKNQLFKKNVLKSRLRTSYDLHMTCVRTYLSRLAQKKLFYDSLKKKWLKFDFYLENFKDYGVWLQWNSSTTRNR